MANQTLVYTKQHDKQNLSFVVEVYKGMTVRRGQFIHERKHYERIVETKAFRLVVKEVKVISRANGVENQTITTKDFGFITSRSSEFMLVDSIIGEKCFSLRDIEIVLANLEKDFRVALDRDAMKAAKKQLSHLFTSQTFTVTSSSFYNGPRLSQ
jgi:hypothetical protein